MTRRGKIRVMSFMLALVTVVSGLAAAGWIKALGLKTQIEYSYIRALSDLETYVTNIDASLEKCLYAGTSEQAVLLSAKVWREAGAAKICLAALPYSDNRLEKTEKFLSQVGEYAYALSLDTARGKNISNEDYKTLKRLSNYAGGLSVTITSMMNDISNRNYTVDEVEEELNGNAEEGKLSDMEATFEDYPTLIYDGPYSDHLVSQTPKLTQNKSKITVEEAKKIAAEFLDIAEGKIEQIGEQNGNLPLYEFNIGETYIAVTKSGGIVSTVNNTREIGETAYGTADALDAAEKYLRNKGISNMKYTYYIEQEDRLIINFAYELEGAVCYTDLIKVYVALDDLSIVGYEAEGYIINHYDRIKPQKIITKEQALNGISKYLTVEKENMAFIAPNGLNEYYTYEFQCVSEDGRQVLVYINAENGDAADMLLLVDTSGGMLTI